MEIKYQSNGQPVALDDEDLREKLGYKVYKPRIGSLGLALIEFNSQRSIGWLSKQVDNFLKKQQRRNDKLQKQNS